MQEQKQLGQEYKIPDEDKIISNIIHEMTTQMKKLYPDKKMLRQIHTKMHGCVRASFTVEPNLPQDLRVGVFSEPKQYHAWVRYSNASTKPKHDRKKDVRGIAIKLLNVPGDKLLKDDPQPNCQDFLLMSSETYFANNLVTIAPTFSAFTSESHLRVLMFILNPMNWKTLGHVQKSMVPCKHPAGIHYWSTQPYRFGDEHRAVKYYLRPSPKNNLVIANTSDWDHLRVNLEQTLNNNELEFDFMVQFQEDADTMPIEDPTVPWTSPHIKMATLKIIPQSFDSPQQWEFGENIYYNIWHSLPAHRPLGNFNRARRHIYEALSKFRHERNQLQITEPQDSPDFLETGYQNSVDVNEQSIPAKNAVYTSAEVLVDCTKESAFKYISASEPLHEWLQKCGPVAGAKTVTATRGPYSQVGATRTVLFDNGDSVQEELISYNPYANYAYKVTNFTNFFKNLTDAAYGRIWFDTVGDKTRIRWVYYFTYKSVFAKLFISMFLPVTFKKYMQNALNIAKQRLQTNA